MKRKNYFIIVLLSALLMAGVTSIAGAATIAIEAPATASTTGTITVSVNLTAMDAADLDNVAGAALTIGYDSSVFEYAGTLSNSEIDVADVASDFFSTVVSDDTISQIPMAGKDENTNQKVMLSGAYVLSDTGLGRSASDAITNGNNTLFGVQFKVKSGVAAGTVGTFTVSETQLFNLDAGWGTDVNEDGQYDAGTDTLGTVPPLMGVETNWSTATPDDPSDDFAELAYSFSPSSVDVEVVEASGSDIPLTAGWNLISISVQPTDTSVESVLAGISGQYESVWTYNPNSFTNWDIHYSDPNLISTLDTIVPGKAYWINATADTTLTVTGSPAPNQVELTAGWNFIGYTGETKPAADVLASISGQYESVWSHNPASFTNWDIYYSDPDLISTLDNFEPGKGYWINATADTTLTY